MIYAGNPDGDRISTCSRLGLGVMIATSSSSRINKEWSRLKCALDNGAFRCWQRGYPFMEKSFLSQLEACYKTGVDLDFITCPDIVTGGVDSLYFSLEWATGVLLSAPRIALVVQDGMSQRDVVSVVKFYKLRNISHIFVGGSEEWKWNTAQTWREVASSLGVLLHIGRCGTVKKLRMAEEIGADSVDSTTFARNDAFDIVEKFRMDSLHPLFSDETES